MNTEGKAKAYNKVREKIALRFGSNVAEEIFSEFEMSEDEKVRKALVDALNKNLGNGIEKYGTTLNAALAWLEKQKEYESTDFEYVWDRTDCGDLTSALDKYSEEAIINMCHAWYDKGIELERKSWLEKQGEEKTVNYPIEGMFPYTDPADTLDGEIENIWNKLRNCDNTFTAAKSGFYEVIHHFANWLEKQGEQKPTDKIESKFHEDEWVSNGDYTWKIIEVTYIFRLHTPITRWKYSR